MAMITKYLIGGVKEKLCHNEDLLKDILNVSSGITQKIEEFEAELVQKMSILETEKGELDKQIAKLSKENVELKNRLDAKSSFEKNARDLKVINKSQSDMIEELEKKLEKYEFILNFEKYKKLL